MREAPRPSGGELAGKAITLCITGSVAAVRSLELARELTRHGASVRVAMTPSAQRLVNPSVMEWATGRPVVTEVTGRAEHIDLASADLVVVAPATAHTISQVANGLSENAVALTLSCALGAGTPILMAPAMNEALFRNPVLVECMTKLRALGVEFVGPRLEEQQAKMAMPSEIVRAAIAKLAKARDLVGRKVLVTAGPTRECLDAVRVITNRSSGKMGIAMAEEALARGARVTLVYGPGTAVPPSMAEVINVETTEEMRSAVESKLGEDRYDIVVLAAAAADYGPSERSPSKIPSGLSELVVRLSPLPKLSERVKKLRPDTLLVGFKAEYKVSDDELTKRAQTFARQTGADLVVANDVGRQGVGFAVDTNEALVVDRDGLVARIPLSPKREVAARVFDLIADRLKGPP